MRCPCRPLSAPRAYGKCCGPYHEGLSVAPTPEALMRSRYSAYALQSSAYLLATWHVSTRPKELAFTDAVAWITLKIHATTMQGDAGTVSFTARFRDAGQVGQLRETSQFVREAGAWFYVCGAVEHD
jgi:SEC-C motif domain protein